jgi:maltose alpha-D-glucosyltransferase/alpha-amylase
MGFWIQLGVIGFRMDAVPFVISTKGAHVKKPVEQYNMLRLLREFLQWRAGDSIVLAEANVLPDTDMEYFGDDGDRMHMMFNFQVNQNLFYALAASDCRPLVHAVNATKIRPRHRSMGFVFAQSRRTGSRPLDRGATPARVRIFWTRERHAAL